MRYLAFILTLLCIPTIVRAEVRITEIAWMGTAESQYSEWIELYNDGPSPVNLNGWKLYEQGGSQLVYSFTKSISAQGYLLLERTTASAPDAVPGISDESGSFGGGGFANSGEYLVLKDATDAVVESLDFSSGWPAGDSATKETMQWNGSSWVTAPATPDGPTEDGGSGQHEVQPEVTGASADKKVLTDDMSLPKVSPNKPHVDFILPGIVYEKVPYTFEAVPVLEFNYKISHGNFYWNMGDGTVITQTAIAPIVHTYQYAGTYTISFQYTDPEHINPTLKGVKRITVGVPALTISRVGSGALRITNSANTAVDLSGWKVAFLGGTAFIPDMTIISDRSSIVLPNTTFSPEGALVQALLDPSGGVVASIGDTTHYIKGDSYSDIDQVSQASTADILTTADTSITDTDKTPPSTRNRTKTYIFGAVALFVIVLSILLERFMAQQEY